MTLYLLLTDLLMVPFLFFLKNFASISFLLPPVPQPKLCPKLFIFSLPQKEQLPKLRFMVFGLLESAYVSYIFTIFHRKNFPPSSYHHLHGRGKLLIHHGIVFPHVCFHPVVKRWEGGMNILYLKRKLQNYYFYLSCRP